MLGRDYYLNLLATDTCICFPGTERSIDIIMCLVLASKINQLPAIKYFLNASLYVKDIGPAIIEAVKNGHLEVIKYLITYHSQHIHNIFIKVVLQSAIIGKHQHIIDYLLLLGYNLPIITDLNKTLEDISTIGIIDLFNHLIDLGSDLRALLMM